MDKWIYHPIHFSGFAEHRALIYTKWISLMHMPEFNMFKTNAKRHNSDAITVIAL